MNDAVSDAPFTPPLSCEVATDHGATSDNGATPNIADPRERDEGIRPHVIEERTSEAFRSILFDGSARAAEGGERTEPGYFSDLNLDQVFTSIATGYEEYDLAPFFYEHLDDANTISYRQEVFRDLERKVVFEPIASFVQQMRDMRAHLKQSNELRYQYQKESWFVDATQIYYDAVVSLALTLAPIELESEGLKRFREYLSNYVQSPAFSSLGADVESVRKSLSEVRYLLRIKGLRVTVAKYDFEADYSAEVLATFERFKQGAAKDYRIGFHNPPDMDHVEANILGLVARLFPEVFSALDDYCARHRDYLDPTIRTFDREVHFYLSYLAHMGQFKSVGLRFCYPKVTRHSKEVFADDTFDLALANRLVPQGSVVCNDFLLSGPERIIVVSGPNQGGKTTFARMFGQLHHLASIGCPVPGRRAQLYLYDKLFAQFEQEEDLANMRGKLEDDLVRIRDVLNEATASSVVVLNEIFTSTTLKDSVFLGMKLMERLIELDLLCVFVTFVEELASLGPTTVSMMSTVVPENPAVRTYKVVRKPADGLAYALAIADKYGLTYGALKKRIAP
jgi:DNA mismatch repair ATPase MutS